jgi:hypothetical protein
VGNSQAVFTIKSIKGGSVSVIIDFMKTGGSATVSMRDREFAPFGDFASSVDDVEEDQAVITPGPDEP